MALINMKSRLDADGKLGVLGRGTAQTDPKLMDYYTEGGTNNSPFTRGGNPIEKGPKEDHLVKLLDNRQISSQNTGQLYPPAENRKSPSYDLDLEGALGGNGYFHEKDTPGKGDGKKLGGVDLHEALLTQAYDYKYGTTPKVTVGPSPGPSGFSRYQDMDGITPTGYNSNQSLLDDNARF